MLGASLEQLGGLFDRRFLQVYWSPVFLGTALAAAIVAFSYRLDRAVQMWVGLGAAEQIAYGIGLIVAITVVAYFLSILAGPLIRIYEGYWAGWVQPIARLLVGWQRWKWRRLQSRMAALRDKSDSILPSRHSKFQQVYARYFSAYPRNPSLLKPTKLGNVLVAAEEYPRLRYNMDAVFWWPRLAAVMPEAVLGQVDASLMPMIALLNLATMIGVAGSGSGIWLWSAQERPVEGLLCVAGGLALAKICYTFAATASARYTQTVRTAFDLYRFDLLKQMHVPPPSPASERALWDGLSKWLYYSDLAYRVDRYDHNLDLAGQAEQEGEKTIT